MGSHCKGTAGENQPVPFAELRAVRKNVAAQHQFARLVDQEAEIKRPRWAHTFSSSMKSIVGLPLDLGELINRLPFFCFRLNIDLEVDQAVIRVYMCAKSKLRDGVEDEKM
jgi:hypothetical protein